MQIIEIGAEWWLSQESMCRKMLSVDFQKAQRLYLVHGLPGFSDDLKDVAEKAHLGDSGSCTYILEQWELQHKQIVRSGGVDLDSLISQHFHHLRRYAHRGDHLSMHTWMAQAEILSSRIFLEMLSTLEKHVRWISLPTLVIGEEDFFEEGLVHLKLQKSSVLEEKLLVTQRSICRMPDGSVGYFPDKLMKLFEVESFEEKSFQSQAA